MTMGVSTWTVSAMWPTVSIPEGIINKVLQTCDKAIFQFPKKSDCVYTAQLYWVQNQAVLNQYRSI